MSRMNQHQLAEMLALSQTTVSRALANHPAINPETKAQVLEAAAKLGYSQRPRRKAPGGGRPRPQVWGVVISMPKQQSGRGEIFQQVLKGIAEKSAAQDSILDVVYHEPELAEDAHLMRRVRAAGWKGVILIYPLHLRLVHELAHQAACVSVIENYRHSLIDSIDVDQAESIHSLVKRLQDLGHRRVGFLTWVYRVPTPWVMHRFGSYVEALYRCNLEFDPRSAVNVRPGEALDRAACAARAAELVRQGVTAFVCPADHQAYFLLSDLAQLGLRVPADVSLTGFDGIPPPLAGQQLATVKVPYEEIGRSAVHQLLRRLEQPTAPRRHILVDGEVLPGDTLGPPRT